MYYPINNKTTGYNQIDFLYLMLSTMRTLASDTTNINLNLYKRLMSYQYPAYNNYINTTNSNLYIAFNRT